MYSDRFDHEESEFPGPRPGKWGLKGLRIKKKKLIFTKGKKRKKHRNWGLQTTYGDETPTNLKLSTRSRSWEGSRAPEMGFKGVKIDFKGRKIDQNTKK